MQHKQSTNMNTEPFTPIAPNLKANGPTSLYFSEKVMSLTGDSGKVKDENGKTVFKIKAKHWTLSDRRLLLDSDGNTIGQARCAKTPGIHEKYYLGTKDDEKRCAVKLKGMLNPLKCDADIYMGKKIIGEVHGDWRAKKYKIIVFDKTVATVKRKRTFNSTFNDADTYGIEVSDGVDTAFITLVIVALDELYHDDKGGLI